MDTLWLQRIWGRARGESCPRSEATRGGSRSKWSRSSTRFHPFTPNPDLREAAGAETGHCARVEVHLEHHVEVLQATERLLGLLDCDNWYVACRHDHQMVIRISKESVVRYVLCFQCSPEVEKAVYHGSRAWALSIIPIHPGDNLTTEQEAAIRALI